MTEIVEFDVNLHDLDRVARLILTAEGRTATAAESVKSAGVIKNLITAGNNFLGHEHIDIAVSGGDITGLVIGYRGAGQGELGTLLRPLVSLRLSELASYMAVVSKLLHGEYTPDIAGDEFYISFLVVDELHRGEGIGSDLLSHAVGKAKELGCKAIILDVDASNEAAMALYGKFGFTASGRSAFPGRHPGAPRTLTLELGLA